MKNVFSDFNNNFYDKLDRWNGNPRAWNYFDADNFICCRWNDWIHFWNDLWFMAVDFHFQNSLPFVYSLVYYLLFYLKYVFKIKLNFFVLTSKLIFLCFRRGRMEKSDDADDLFAGLDPPRPKTNPSTSAASRNDFMSSLFGGGGSKTNTASATSNPTKSRDFVLEEKYTNPANNNTAAMAASDISSAKPPTAAQRSRRGSPFMTAPNLPTASKTSDFDQPPSNPNFNFEPTSTVVTTSDPTRLSTTTSTVISSNKVTEAMKNQFSQMEEFEKEQQTKFVRDLEDHKRQLDVQQAEHRNILGNYLKNFF